MLNFRDENQFCEVVDGQYKRLRVNFKIALARFSQFIVFKKVTTKTVEELDKSAM